jgi:large subunit ribosomal protein L30
MARRLKLTLTRSLHGRAKNHRACARGLGLRRIHNPVLVPATPENQGMIDKIRYMLKIEDVGGEPE